MLAYEGAVLLYLRYTVKEKSGQKRFLSMMSLLPEKVIKASDDLLG